MGDPGIFNTGIQSDYRWGLKDTAQIRRENVSVVGA
jgi:hypothetical protein